MNDRVHHTQAAPFWLGPFCLSVAERTLKRAGEPVRVGSRAIEILIALVERAGEIVTHKELISMAWPHATVEEANLRVHIAALRKSLGGGMAGARYISNVVGRGYCFVAPVSRSPVEEKAAVSGENAEGPCHKLPPPPRMIGRDQIVTEVTKQLAARRFVSIVGPGGVGKTTVASRSRIRPLVHLTERCFSSISAHFQIRGSS
jgi:DNA-binding winged helix-turn-helix (wHTH) protein